MAFRKIPRAGQREMPLHCWIYGHCCFPVGQLCAVAIHQEQLPFLTSICPIVSWYSLSLVLKKDSVSWIKFPRFSSCRGERTQKISKEIKKFRRELKILFSLPGNAGYCAPSCTDFLKTLFHTLGTFFFSLEYQENTFLCHDHSSGHTKERADQGSSN